MGENCNYQAEYYQTHKNNIKENRRIRNQLEKLTKMKEELSKIQLDPINPYVEKIKNIKSYNCQMKRQFFLQYDIDHLHSRICGDTNEYNQKREEAYKNYWREWDLKNRIVKWRLFRKAILTRTNEEPTNIQCHYNDVICPKEIISDHKDYRPDLMYLTQIQADDPLIHVTIASDWAREDEKLYKKKKKNDSEEYENLLRDEGLI